MYANGQEEGRKANSSPVLGKEGALVAPPLTLNKDRLIENPPQMLLK